MKALAMALIEDPENIWFVAGSISDAAHRKLELYFASMRSHRQLGSAQIAEIARILQEHTTTASDTEQADDL